MDWEEIYTRGFVFENLTRESEEYQVMLKAAIAGNPSAEYYLALWREKKEKTPEIAKIWLKKSANHNFPNDFPKAKKVLERIEKDSSLTIERADIIESADGDFVVESQSTALLIKERDFQEAKNSLLQYVEKAQTEVYIKRVPTDGGLFYLGNHKVTGSELNVITRQIQDYLIQQNNLCIGLVEEFNTVYKTFEALDRDYIKAIVTSINAAAEISSKEKQDREDIRKLVDNHEKIVDVLVKFKENIEKLSKLTTVNDEWEAKSKLINECNEYIDKLRNLKHILEIDALWDNTQSVRDDVLNLKQLEIGSRLGEIEKKQESFRTEFDQVKKDQNDKLEATKKEMSENIESAIEKQESSIQNFKEGQSRRIDELSAEQTSKLEDMSNKQTSALEQIATEQTNKIKVIHESLEKEKIALNDKVAVLKQKIVYLYLVAGGATALTVVQLILNILDII